MKRTTASLLIVLVCFVAAQLGYPATAVAGTLSQTLPNLILNPEFDSGTNNWLLKQWGTGSGSFSVVTGAGLSGANAAKVTINSPGTAPQHIQLRQSFAITGGKVYQVSFMAKADATRKITVVIQQTDDPWTTYWSQEIILNTTAQTFGPITVNAPATDSTTLFQFDLGNHSFGGDNATVYVDNIIVNDITNQPPPPPAFGTDWLRNQQTPNSMFPYPYARSGALASIIVPVPDPDYQFVYARSWTYDDAVALIAFALQNDCLSARKVADGLASVVEPDGKLSFSFNLNDDFVDGLYRTGAISWAGYSLALFQRRCADTTYQSVATNIANWVLTMQDATGSVKGGPDVSWHSTEHNIDAYFFLRTLGEITGNAAYTNAATQIKDSLLAPATATTGHWNTTYGCFQQGIGDPAKALDTASWGGIFLLSLGDPAYTLRANSCVNFLEATFANSKNCVINNVNVQVDGYMPYATDHGGHEDVIWSEGSLGVALLYKRLGNQTKYDDIIANINEMTGPRGGIYYACTDVAPGIETDFHQWEQVAGTGWKVMVESPNQIHFWPPADLIFADSFESGNLSAWSSSVTDGSDLSVSTAAALSGAYGLQAVIDSNGAIYATDQTPQAETRYRARFYFDPNSITMASGDLHDIFRAYQGGTTTAPTGIQLRFDQGFHQVRAWVRRDNGSVAYTAWAPITDAPHALEINWSAATAAGANDGYVELYVDGNLMDAEWNLDNDTRRVDYVRLGPLFIDTGTRGTYYFDAFESRRATYIGP